MKIKKKKRRTPRKIIHDDVFDYINQSDRNCITKMI